MTDGERMALTASVYQTRSVIVTPVGNGTLTVLQKDPRRFYVEIRQWGTNKYPVVYPGNLPDGAVAGVTTDAHDKYKYHDCPGVVTGEFVLIADGAIGSLLIITDTYVGD